MGHEALSKGWAALPRPRVKVTPKGGQVNPVKDLHSGTRFREATLALWSSRLAAQRTESGWKCPRSHGRTLTQGHFCTNGGCLALLESHQAWLKRKLCSTCLIFKAGPALSQGLGQRPLEGSQPICCCSRLSHGQACQYQLAGIAGIRAHSQTAAGMSPSTLGSPALTKRLQAGARTSM